MNPDEPSPTPTTFNCPSCGGPLEILPKMGPVIRCKYCQNPVVIPEELRKPDRSPFFEGNMEDMLQEATQLAEVARLVKNNQKIDAIKLYREITGQGLKESKDAIEKLERGEPLQITQTQVQNSQSEFSPENFQEQLPQIQDLIRQGNKLEAIKLYREISGSGLKEAKDVIEALQTNLISVESASGPISSTITGPIEARSNKASTKKTGGYVMGCSATMFTAFLLIGVIVFVIGIMMTEGGPLHGLWLRINPVTNYREALSFGGEGIGPGLFSDLRSVAVDNQGSIYAADYSGERVQVFDETGKFIAQWAPASPGDIIYNMTADRNGNLFIAQDGDIYRFEGATGKFLGLVEYGDQWNYIDDISVTADGGLVAVADGETIVRFNNAWQVSLIITDAISTVSGESELDTRLAVDGLGNIYALGSFNDSVFKFSPDGRFITRFGSDGDEPGQIQAASAIAVDGQGRVYISDFNGIQVFASDGRFLERMDIRGIAYGMAFNDRNELWIASNNQQIIQYKILR